MDSERQWCESQGYQWVVDPRNPAGFCLPEKGAMERGGARLTAQQFDPVYVFTPPAAKKETNWIWVGAALLAAAGGAYILYQRGRQ